jgi:serine dehydrogenase proteinase
VNAARYQRQSVIHRIQGRTGRPLICYVAGMAASVTRDDTLGFADLLHNLQGPLALDLLLHTAGGDIDAAEKLMSMVRTKVGSAHLRAIVPDFAKSAGTLMVLAADSVMMSNSSELGPIDPQVVSVDSSGNRRAHSVQDYLDAYEQHRQTLVANPDDVAARLMLGKIDPATVKRFEAALSRARSIAEKHLRQGMFRTGGPWSAAAAELLDTRRWKSHGQMISWEDAKDAKLGLNVEHIPPEDELWCDIWQLYCLQRLAVEDKQKLFESAIVSIPMDGGT